MLTNAFKASSEFQASNNPVYLQKGHVSVHPALSQEHSRQSQAAVNNPLASQPTGTN